ncbi:MAG: ankyrin repeat domain-containing protein [Synergistaceae bacterium]|nr:ankyrin repeat domain-containing protein [Synergistaceae bacterium]
MPARKFIALFIAFSFIINIAAFSEAAKKQKIDVFKLAKNGTLSELKTAAKKGANFNVRRHYDEFPENYDDSDLTALDSSTPLFWAVAYNHNKGVIKFLVSQGLNVNDSCGAGNSYSANPLAFAVDSENLQAVRELIESGAKIHDNEVIDGNMFITLADKTSSTARLIFAEILKAGGNVNEHYEPAPDERKIYTLPLNKWTSTDPTENLLDSLAHYEWGIFRASCPALMFAVFYDNPVMIDLLLDSGADANIINAEGRKALDYAMIKPINSKIKRSKSFKRLQAATKK